MPELPEVETARGLAAHHLVGRRIVGVAVADDPIVYEAVSRPRVRRALMNRTVVGSGRRGKHLWLELDRRPWPVFHFGMTGSLRIYRAARDRPRFWKIELVTDDGTRLAMTNKRRLGRIRLRDDPASEPPISALGFDPMIDLPSAAVLGQRLGRRRAPIKAVLLDQSLFAGVGNWIADEVLFQARIDPRRLASELAPGEIRRLRTRLSAVVRKACDVGADDQRFPRTWLFHVRWGKRRGARTRGGDALAFDTIGGRTTAWVPAVQK